MTIAITGATGGIGGAVARHLAATQDLRLIGRDLGRLEPLARMLGAAASQGDYIDTASMTDALRGASTLFLVSGRESADRVAEHVSAIDAAVAAGIERIVYLSFIGASRDATFTFARDHFATEEHIRQTGIAHTFLRDSFYQSAFPHMVGDGGVIRGPAGDGRVSLVSTDDVADAAARVLADPGLAGTFTLTGPDALTLASIAEVLSTVTSREISYVEETVDEAYASRAHYGAPAFEVDGWVSTYTAIANGEFEQLTDDVLTITGHPPQSFERFLLAQPSSWAHLL